MKKLNVIRHPLANQMRVEDLLDRVRKTPRNAPCPCGSGRKFKKCCMPRLKSNNVY